MTNKTKSFILLFLALAILNAIPTSTEARLYGRRRTKSIKQSYQEPTMGFMDEIDRHGVGSGIDWMNGCDRKKCPCGCEPCQSGLCRCYSWCRGDELGYSNNFDLQYPDLPRLPPLDEIDNTNNFDLQYPAYPRLPPLDEVEDDAIDQVGFGGVRYSPKVKCLNTCNTNQRSCLRIIPGIVTRPNDDYVRSKVRKCASAKKFCSSKCTSLSTMDLMFEDEENDNENVGWGFDSGNSWLKTLGTAHLNSGPTGSCVTTTLGNMDRLNIPSFSGGTSSDPNNSRGAMVQMIKAGKWKSKRLSGCRSTSIKSPYGTVSACVIGADAYERMAKNGKVTNGAIIFQTRHGWNANSGSSGNDMGIVRNNGRNTFNYRLMSPIIYSDAKEVVILVPK